MSKHVFLTTESKVNIDALLLKLLELKPPDRLDIVKTLMGSLPDGDRAKLYKFMDKYYEVTDWVEAKNEGRSKNKKGIEN